MTLRFTCLCSLIVLFSCKHETAFINYDKWQPLFAKQGILKGQPREVKTIYYTVKDTTFFGQDKVETTTIDKFDSEGNLIYNSTTTNNIMSSETSYQYTDQGLQYVMCIRRPQEPGSCKETNSQKTAREGINTFRSTFYRNDSLEYNELYTFEPGKVTRVRTFSTGKKSTFVLWYRDGRLVKTEIKGSPSVTTNYYRNEKGVLDSTRTDYYREVFINNKQGDPLEYCELRRNDTIAYERYMYEYDAKDNWVKRLTFSRVDEGSVFNNDKFPGCSLDVREIKY